MEAHRCSFSLLRSIVMLKIWKITSIIKDFWIFINCKNENVWLSSKTNGDIPYILEKKKRFLDFLEICSYFDKFAKNNLFLIKQEPFQIILSHI